MAGWNGVREWMEGVGMTYKIVVMFQHLKFVSAPIATRASLCFVLSPLDLQWPSHSDIMNYCLTLGTLLLQILSVCSAQYNAVVFPDDNYVAESQVAAEQVYYVEPQQDPSQGNAALLKTFRIW